MPKTGPTKRKKPYRRMRPNRKRKLPNAAALSISDTAKATGFGISAVRTLINNREIPSFVVGRKRYVLRSVLKRWLEERGNPTAA